MTAADQGHSVNEITQMMVQISRAGAGTWIMWFMVALSVVSLILIVERFIFFWRRMGDAELLHAGLSEQLREGDLPGAKALVQDQDNMVANIAQTGIERLSDGLDSCQEAMEARTALEKLRFERGLTVLGTLGANAPFIGLLGTVVEIIVTLGREGGISPEALPMMMKDLATALAATAVGLVVALPAVAANNYFRRRLNTGLAASEIVRRELAAYALRLPPKGDF
ncbi:MAG: MotA/TolQ/ExbB proton channel family protein [Myxococcota bacterium]|nr:flagellar motor protein MotA [Myxococcales bacterium]MEC7752325.1 MotA/TolQ/ExbB proton channel family protein [Myxococcota bacterium]HBU48967.1 MotA/TolQ/ExbB proton channel family protein [Myxococcales bacterium]|tara:strand:- start:729 stop:1403 length:675 start_codon:yes stop_codon:yes gene_type:complete